MGHAIDPERGMLFHYNTFFGGNDTYFVSKIVFDITSESWFKSARGEKEIRKELSSIDFIGKVNLIDFLLKGLSAPSPNELMDIVQGTEDDVYDISDYVERNFPNFNSELRNIFENSSCLYLSNGADSELFLTWDNVIAEWDYQFFPKVSVIRDRKTLSEDDITYITMNEVFRLNNIIPVSVSYPGAQSDTPILADPKSGRKQSRTYVDSVGIKGDYLILQENKGSFELKKVAEDIKKISKFKNDSSHVQAVFHFTVEMGLDVKEILIGVGFRISESM